MGVNVSVEINKAGITEKIKKLGKLGTKILTNEVVKDCNYFIPFDEGELMKSAIRESDFENGKAIWDTPYARRLYYNPQYDFNTAGKFDIADDGNLGKWKPGNPNAQGLWFEAAKAANLDKWTKLIDTLIKGGL